MNDKNKVAVSPSRPLIGCAAVPVVVLAWGQKKRHIAVDDNVLCEPKFSNKVRQRGSCGYNSLTISGIPQYEKTVPDSKYTHTDGKIEFSPINQQSGIIQKSICNQCFKKYARLFD